MWCHEGTFGEMAGPVLRDMVTCKNYAPTRPVRRKKDGTVLLSADWLAGGCENGTARLGAIRNSADSYGKAGPSAAFGVELLRWIGERG